jgi:hypothetical protein
VAKRDFTLPEACQDTLGRRGLSYETLIEGEARFIVIQDFPVPQGFNYEKVSVCIRIPPGYPDSPLDMAYFKPALARVNGRPINKLSDEKFLGETWQRWSRHRHHAPWDPEFDGIGTHLAFIDTWLREELQK